MKTTQATVKRARGDGSVYLRGNVYWIKYHSRGRAYRESSGSQKVRDAGGLLRRRLAEVASGRHAPNAERVTLDDLVQMLEDDYRVNSRSSWPRTQQRLAHIRQHFSAMRAVDMTADRIASFVRMRMDMGAAPASIAAELATLKRAFTLAVRSGRLLNKPAFPTIQLDNARIGFFEEAEFQALMRELPDYLRAPITFAYLTGWRVASEILRLRWSQVDLTAGFVRLDVGTTKNREGREWPLDALPELRNLLEQQREQTRAIERATSAVVPFVFHRSGRAIKDFRSAWRSACSRAGLVGHIPHDFRRTAVRNLERAGVPRSVAMKLVGHRTEEIYRRYAIVSSRDLADGVAKLARLRESAPALSERGTFVAPMRA
jgi:integrase